MLRKYRENSGNLGGLGSKSEKQGNMRTQQCSSQTIKQRMMQPQKFQELENKDQF